MKYLRFGRTGLKVSKVAFGGIPIMRLSKPDAVRLLKQVLDLGINFIDTANVYNDSEEKIGGAIRSVPRESVIIASKSQATDKKTFQEHIDLSLKRLRTDYIDIYQMHNISNMERKEKIFGPGGALEGLEEAVKAGKVRFRGFSSHSCRTAAEIMKTGVYDSVQLPFNFIDTEAKTNAIPLARELDMGFIAMKPMGGGMLEKAGPAFRYLLQFDNIVPDPGIEKIEEMEEIVKLINNPEPLSSEDWKQIEALREELGSQWCHRCDYCQPCPQGIHISYVLNIKSSLKRMPAERAYRMLNKDMEQTLACTECRECVSRCPYNLQVPELLKQKKIIWDEALKSGEVPVI